MVTIHEAICSYLQIISDTRSSNTAKTYRNALNAFEITLTRLSCPTLSTPAVMLKEDIVSDFANDLRGKSSSTEILYLSAIKGFYEYLVADKLGSPNLSRLKLLIRQRSRKSGQRLPQFPRDDIEKILNFAVILKDAPVNNFSECLINLRDRAFLLTLADTGLRVHEACNLIRGDIDWNEGKAIIIGKGNQQAVIRFSNRSLLALKDYLSARAAIDGSSGRPLSSLPLFSRHDKGASKRIRRITTTTGRNIVSARVVQVLGAEAIGKITPHSFRHFFVTTVLLASSNLKLAQELARHKNIAVTQRYSHLADNELDSGYFHIFDEGKN